MKLYIGTYTKGSMSAKVGNFDWIIDYDDVAEYFGAKYLNIAKPIDSQQLLVIGCGESTFFIFFKSFCSLTTLQ